MAPETAEVVVLFFEENGLNDGTARILLGQLRDAQSSNGPEPVRRALVELADSLRNGQRPADPRKLPNYFAPILKRAIETWQREERELREQERRERERQERLALVGQERAQEGEDKPRPFERFLSKHRLAAGSTDETTEAARRELLHEQARRLRAEAGTEEALYVGQT